MGSAQNRLFGGFWGQKIRKSEFLPNFLAGLMVSDFIFNFWWTPADRHDIVRKNNINL